MIYMCCSSFSGLKLLSGLVKDMNELAKWKAMFWGKKHKWPEFEIQWALLAGLVALGIISILGDDSYRSWNMLKAVQKGIAPLWKHLQKSMTLVPRRKKENRLASCKLLHPRLSPSITTSTSIGRCERHRPKSGPVRFQKMADHLLDHPELGG